MLSLGTDKLSNTILVASIVSNMCIIQSTFARLAFNSSPKIQRDVVAWRTGTIHQPFSLLCFITSYRNTSSHANISCFRIGGNVTPLLHRPRRDIKRHKPMRCCFRLVFGRVCPFENLLHEIFVRREIPRGEHALQNHIFWGCLHPNARLRKLYWRC